MRIPPEKRNQKGIFPIVIKAESVKVTQLERKGSAVATPPKETKSVHSVPLYNTKSHQPLYSEEIFMQKVNKDWKGFNS